MDEGPPQKSMAEEQEDRRKHKEEQKRWDAIWMERAERKDWNQVKVPLEAYRYSGLTEEITADPRQEEAYVRQTMEALGSLRVERMSGTSRRADGG